MRLEVAQQRPPPLHGLAPAGDLPDVNVWLALAVQEHQHHLAARAYWEREQPSRIWFNRVTMLALVRLLCQPKVMGAGVVDLHKAFAIYKGFAELPEIGQLADDETCERKLEPLLGSAQRPLPARLWTDAYLAAFAQSANLRVVTFDSDFERFAGLCVLRLPMSST